MNNTPHKTLYKANKPVTFKINTIFLIVFVLFFFLMFLAIGLLTVNNMQFILNTI